MRKVYPYIKAWGRMMQSYDYYINGQVELAQKENAPQDAIYRGSDGTWSRFGDIVAEDTKQRVLSLLPK
jgi:hypothetical protein